MDLISFIAGLVVGIAALSIAIEFAWKKSIPEKTCKLIKRWNLNEIKNALIVAEKIHVTPPENARIVVSNLTPHARNARENPDVIGNFAVGTNKAFIFSGEIKEGQIAIVTADEDILKELRNIFYNFWKKEKKFVSYVPKKGRVRVRGIVRAVIPYRDGYLIRLSYEGGIIGIIIKEKMDVEGRKIEVDGEVIEYPFIKPSKINIIE